MDQFLDKQVEEDRERAATATPEERLRWTQNTIAMLQRKLEAMAEHFADPGLIRWREAQADARGLATGAIWVQQLIASGEKEVKKVEITVRQRRSEAPVADERGADEQT